MSDSSKEGEDFNALQYVRLLCKEKNVTVNLGGIQFMKGWTEIFEDFLIGVGKCNFTILRASDEYQFLDIEVEMNGSRSASRIYGAILRAKYYSRMICANCGSRKSENEIKLCEECIGNAVEMKATGTWLDNF